MSFKKISFNASLKLASLFLIVLLLHGCNTNKIEIGEITNMSYKGAINNTIIFEADVLVDNPKIFKITISQIDASISVNKLGLGKISKIDTLIIPAKTKEIHKVKMYLEVTNIAGGLLAVIQMFGRKRSMFEIKGTLKIKYFIFTRTIEFKKRSRSGSSKKRSPKIQNTNSN